MRSTLQTASVGIMLLALGTHELSASDALAAFHAKYRSLNSLRMTFSGSDGVSGSISARRGGMYRIEVAGRTIICDGKTVWSGDASTRSVVINTYKPLSTDVSLERVFFEIMSVYRSQVVQSSATSTILRLTAPEPAAVIANVTSLDVTLNASYTVTQITVASGPSRITYAISRFKRNPSLTAASFRYSPPKGWEVIDLR